MHNNLVRSFQSQAFCKDPQPRDCQDATCLIPGKHAHHPHTPSVHHAMAYAASVDLSPEPKTYSEAMRDADAELWVAAMQEELQSLQQAGTWSLVDLPAGQSTVGCKWVFKRKLGKDGTVIRHKARLVAQGFTQVPGRDFEETYAPVAKYTSIRCLLASAAAQDWELHQMDVETAYLNAPVAEDIYMNQPLGNTQVGHDGTPLVCKLHKSLYGLKQSARNWNEVIDAWLQEQMTSAMCTGSMHLH